MGAGASVASGPQDMSFLDMMIEFTKEANDAVANKTAPELVKKLTEKRNEVIMKARGELDAQERLKANTKIVLLQEQLYTALGLPDNWATEMKYEKTETGCEASCGEHKIQLGSNFPAGVPRLVVTPLTRVCRQKIFEAAATGKVCHFFGPPGTGKTETMKDTLRDMGLDLTVYNCSDSMTAEDIQKAIGEGKPLIFDEFNRLPAELQKEFASLIPKEKPTIGITCNVAAGKECELPEELKSMCVSQAMTVPDFALILEIMFFCGGFLEGQELGSKLAKTMQSCREKLSNQVHYDLGLRKLKSLCSSCGRAGSTEKFVDENVIVANAVFQGLYEMLNGADRKLLKDIVKEHFDIEVTPPAGATEGDRWAQTAAALGRVTKVRHGAMCVNVSKDDVDACVAAAGEAAKVAGASVVRMPGDMSVALEELFGKKEGEEWSDGAFTKALREALEKKSWLVVVCGEFSDDARGSFKFEQLNTLLDDNKMLCLQSGEKLKLASESIIVFVANDCKTLSPATVSRLGVVWSE
eukprot:TRINITY_DN30778_c0_g1_i1.p1 TRINITY_DN30778_c0_g1~~TRINITY_DN30778_c0_g1_i1.p1  ORF type:complete len:525 (-),score=110.76 TRINITY_DN30778_c0_g1_i1:172-1746(-)